MYNRMDKTGQVLKKTITDDHGTPKPVYTAKGRAVDCGFGRTSVSKLDIGGKLTFVETREFFSTYDSGIENGDKVTVDSITYDIISAHVVGAHHLKATVRRCP